MAYTHLTPDELVLIESYFHIHQPASKVAGLLKRSRQTIYNVYHALERWITTNNTSKTNPAAADAPLSCLMIKQDTFKRWSIKGGHQMCSSVVARK